MNEQVTDERIAEIRAMFERSEFWDMPAENVIGDLLLVLDAASVERDALLHAREVLTAAGGEIVRQLRVAEAERDAAQVERDEARIERVVKQAEAIDAKVRLKYIGEIKEQTERAEAAEAELARLRAQRTEVEKHARAVVVAWEDEDDNITDGTFIELIETLKAALPAPPDTEGA